MAPPTPDRATAHLREWAIERYESNPQVRSTCLALQDAHGVDVVALLALWWGCVHGRHTDASFEQWVTSTQRWADDVVGPLRRARRATPPGRLREQIASTEVAAEVDQLDQLMATAPPPIGEPAAAGTFEREALDLLVLAGDREAARRLLAQLSDPA